MMDRSQPPGCPARNSPWARRSWSMSFRLACRRGCRARRAVAGGARGAAVLQLGQDTLDGRSLGLGHTIGVVIGRKTPGTHVGRVRGQALGDDAPRLTVAARNLGG